MKCLRWLVLSICLGACGDRTDHSTLSVTDSLGIRLIRSTGAGWSAGDEWALDLALDVGEADGPNAFGNLRDVAPRREGGLWVLDGQAARVRAFDAAGREVLGFGRKGPGPGEFGSVAYVAQLPDGRIAVAGSGPLRVQYFTASGEYQAERQVPDSLYRGGSSRDDERPPGPVVGRWRIASDGTPFVHVVQFQSTTRGIVRRDLLLRLAHGARDGARLSQWESTAMEGGPGGGMRLLMPDASWSPLSDGGAWFTPGDEYRVLRLDETGASPAIVERPHDPRPVSAAVRKAALSELRRTMDSEFERSMLDRAVFPAALAATYGLWVSRPSGRLWVGVVDHDEDWDYRGPNAWDVFQPDGAHLGRLPIPAGFRPTRITDDGVYGVWRDELGVPHARRYAIVRPVR
jgi:hypothetical protein